MSRNTGASRKTQQPEADPKEDAGSSDDQESDLTKALREFRKESQESQAKALRELKQEFEEREALLEAKFEKLEKELAARSDESEVLKKTIRSLALAGSPQPSKGPGSALDIMSLRAPKMPMFDPKAQYFDQWLRTFILRTRGLPDEEKARFLASHLVGDLADFGATTLIEVYNRKPAVPVIFVDYCNEIRVRLYGPHWAQLRVEKILGKKQDRHVPLSHFQYEFVQGLQDMAPYAPTGMVPATDREKLAIFVRLLDPELRSKMKEHELEFDTIQGYVQKAERKGLGWFKKDNPGDMSPRPASRSHTTGNSRNQSAYFATDIVVEGGSDSEVEGAYEGSYTYGYDKPYVGH